MGRTGSIQRPDTAGFALNRNIHSMCVFHFTETEVLHILTKLKNKGSSGPDDIPCTLLRRVADLLVSPLTQLINLSFERGVFPTVLKTSKVIPIHKKNTRTNATNYRPISMSSSFSKIFEYAMLSRLLRHLEVNHILTDRQHGFRRDQSTITAINSFLSDALLSLDRQEFAVGVFCDLSKAFDCVSHRLLLQKMQLYGIRGVVADWFTSYLVDRFQFVRLRFREGDVFREFHSVLLPVQIGVPQGSILGPILFLLFINDIVLFVNYSLVMYADDTSCIISDREPNELQVKANALLERLGGWFNQNFLHLNLEKTNFMRFHVPQSKKEPNLRLSVNGADIEQVSSVAFLGLTVDDVFSWRAHCNELISKLNKYCFLIRNLKRYLEMDHIMSFYFAHVHSRLSYGVAFWGSSSAAEGVFVAQKRIVRCLANIRSTDSCRPFFNKFKLLTLPSIFILETLCLFFRNRNNIPRNSDIHSYNTRTSTLFRVPLSRLNLTKRGPVPLGIKLFNSLPGELKNCPDQKCFRNGVKSLLLSRCVYGVDEFLNILRS